MLTKKLQNLLVSGIERLGVDRVFNALNRNKKRQIELTLEDLGSKVCGNFHRDEIDGKRRCDCPFISDKQWHLSLNFGSYLEAPIILEWAKNKADLRPVYQEIHYKYKEIIAFVDKYASAEIKQRTCIYCKHLANIENISR